METIYYTVQRLDGDYAMLVSDEGVKNTVARALLPAEIEMCIRDRTYAPIDH